MMENAQIAAKLLLEDVFSEVRPAKAEAYKLRSALTFDLRQDPEADIQHAIGNGTVNAAL